MYVLLAQTVRLQLWGQRPLTLPRPQPFGGQQCSRVSPKTDWAGFTINQDAPMKRNEGKKNKIGKGGKGILFILIN